MTSSPPSLALPDGALYTLTWSIPHQFGGLTKSLLQRSCQIATASGREVVVITLAAQPNLDDERASLRERGLLVDGVSILNLWEELGQADDDIWADAPFDPTIRAVELDGSRPTTSARSSSRRQRPRPPAVADARRDQHPDASAATRSSAPRSGTATARSAAAGTACGRSGDGGSTARSRGRRT